MESFAAPAALIGQPAQTGRSPQLLLYCSPPPNSHNYTRSAHPKTTIQLSKGRDHVNYQGRPKTKDNCCNGTYDYQRF